MATACARNYRIPKNLGVNPPDTHEILSVRNLSTKHQLANRARSQLQQLGGIDPKLVEAEEGKPVDGLRAEELVPDAAGHATSLAFAKVKLPDARRGGVLGQASVLTLTASAPETRFIGFVNREMAAASSTIPELIETVTVPVNARTRVEWVRGEQQLLPRLAARAGVELLHSLGGTVLASDEASSEVFSMPKATIDRGHAIDQVAPVDGGCCCPVDPWSIQLSTTS